MYILHIKMNNWMVFRGSQKILFPTENDKNIMVIFAENNFGKSCLATAFEWCLYGEIRSTTKTGLDKLELLNSDAYRADEKELFVELSIIDNEDEYLITRKLDFSELIPKEIVDLKLNGRPKSADAIPTLINDLIPQQIAHFFLFDGELLDKFEKLAGDEPNHQASEMKESIETSLGIPILSKASAQLNSLSRIYGKKVVAAQKQSTTKNQLLINLNQLTEERHKKQEELNDIENHIKENEKYIGELSLKIDEANKQNTKFVEEKMLRDNLLENREKIESYEQKLKDINKEIWTVPLFELLNPIKTEFEEERSKKESEAIRIGELQLKILDLRQSKDDAKCKWCNQDLSQKENTFLDEQIKNLEEQINGAEASSLRKEADDLTLKISKITMKNIKDDFGRSKVLSEEIDNLKINNNKIDAKRVELKKLIANFDEGKNRTIINDNENRIEERGRLHQSKETCKEHLVKTDNEIKSIRSNPLYIHDKDNSIDSNMNSIIDILDEVFKSGVIQYREKLRQRVSERANLSFKMVTTENNFDKLEINERFGLDLWVNGQLLKRSKGVEQAVALCLIEAINNLGRRKGPMIMDSPLGRLDLGHRKKILEYLPSCVTQLVIFAHSGDIEEDNIRFDPKLIGKRYKIERISPFHSELKELSR